jgi:CID domain
MDGLRQTLARLDSSSQSVQAAASAMMKHYDQAVIAVDEWRNALQVARGEQLLALLYVANEVLQNSKRNRGRNFLEGMSPVLSQALQHICQRDGSLVEKVRRVVKIWGDRQIFSVRFVNELLQALGPYRDQFLHQQQQRRPSATQASLASAQRQAKAMPKAEPEIVNIDDDDDDDDEEDDDILNILEEREQEAENGESADDDDDEDDLFANDGSGSKLQVDLNIDSLAATSLSAVHPSAGKRRRSLDSSGGGSSVRSGAAGGADINKRRATQRRKSSLLTDSLSTWQRLAQLKQSAYHAQLVLDKIDTALGKVSKKELEDLVGDELQQAFRENTRFQQQVVEQRKLLHEIALETHMIEEDCLRYLPWLERAAQQDTDDVKFCDDLIAKIKAFQRVHPSIRRARELRLEEERLRQIEQEKLEEQRRRQEEDKRFREAALAKETEAKPGMVWNPSTREYQALNTDESWRD